MQRAVPFALLAAVSCLDAETEPPDLGSTEQPLYSDLGGVGPDNGIEWQIDAPWRLEPDAAGNYDAIPLVITINDVSEQSTAPGSASDVRPFERFCGMYVIDRGRGPVGSPVTFFPPSAFHEIEGQRAWLAHDGGVPEGGAGFHQLRRMWTSPPDDPADVLTISDWAEWNAVALYTPVVPRSPGEDIDLIAVARVSHTGTCYVPDLEMTGAELMRQLDDGRLSVHTFPSGGGASYFLGEFLSIHLGEAPLPRFSDEWVYGDLHYHSQGTDNDGESGVSYRATIQAMKAMGLDYAFATEHASDSPQLIRATPYVVDDLPDLPYVPDWFGLEDWVKRKIIRFMNDAGVQGLATDFATLRDLSASRFAHLHGWLNEPGTGVNAEVGSTGGSDRRPQIFLGGEVDAIPEMSAEDKLRGGFAYGQGRWYGVNEPCFGLPEELLLYTTWESQCVGNLVTPSGDPARWLIRDIQGTLGFEPARQHLVHLPARGDDPTAFVSSSTRTWGGASRRLTTILADDIQARDTGYVFLAHPVDAPSGNGPGRLGPDIVPYSEAQLMTAFAAPEVLGLQLWNEDARVHTSAADGSFPMVDVRGIPEPELGGELMLFDMDWEWAEQDETPVLVRLHQGAAMWDRVLLWGITPARLAAAGLVTDQPRKLFMAGGSDAHGDLNFRREGRLLGWSSANDTAIGKPRNLTFVGPHGGRPTYDQVIDGLVSGAFSVTDGPALRIAIDANGSGAIDAGDVPMGGDFAITGATVPVLVEWRSTEEFGGVSDIDLYVGVQAGSHEGLVYAPIAHGMIGSGQCVESATPIRDGSGFEYCPMRDGYVRDDSGVLHVSVPADQRLSGTAVVHLAPGDYKLFDTACETRVIEVVDDDGTVLTSELTMCRAENVQAPERLYVRAFARTEGPWTAVHRLAYTNPIWMTSEQVASAPLIELAFRSCSAGTNTFDVAVSQGAVPGLITAQYRIGSSAWSLLSGSTISAPGGQTVSVRAYACNAHGCSAWAMASRSGPTCTPPPPPAPKVHLEYVRCASGVNTFVATVTKTGTTPVTSWVKQYKIGSTGSWYNLSSPTITAGSGKRVYLRARACNAYGCSSYASTSRAGPVCKPSGGGGTYPL